MSIGDAIQPSHPLSSPSPPAFNLSQHQGVFQWVCSHQEAKVLEFQLQHLSFQWTFRTDFLYDWLVWSPCNPRDSQGSSPTPQIKSINSSALNFMVQLSHPYMTTGKTIVLTRWTFVSKVMSVFFNMLSRLVIAFLPGSKYLLISWLQSLSAMTLESKKILCHCFHCFPIYLPWIDWTGCHDLRLWMLSFKPAFSLSLLSLSWRVSLVPLCSLPWGWCHLHIWGYGYFSQQSWFQLLLHPAWHYVHCIKVK